MSTDTIENGRTGNEKGNWTTFAIIGVVLVVIMAALMLARIGTPKPMNREGAQERQQQAVVAPAPEETGGEMIPAWWSPGGELVGTIDLSGVTITDTTTDQTYVEACNAEASCVWVLRTDADLPSVPPTAFIEPTSVTQAVYQEPVPVYVAPVAPAVVETPPCSDVIVFGTFAGSVCAWTAEERMEQAQAMTAAYMETHQMTGIVYAAEEPTREAAPFGAEWDCEVYGTNCPRPTVAPVVDTPLLQE